MSDRNGSISERVRLAIATVAKVPIEHVKPESRLSELGISGNKTFEMLGHIWVDCECAHVGPVHAACAGNVENLIIEVRSAIEQREAVLA